MPWGELHTANATAAIINRTCFMPATLRLTGSGVNTGSLFLPRKKEGGVYTSDSHWGGGGAPWWCLRTNPNNFSFISVHHSSYSALGGISWEV
jgi:hypothetical protein